MECKIFLSWIQFWSICSNLSVSNPYSSIFFFSQVEVHPAIQTSHRRTEDTFMWRGSYIKYTQSSSLGTISIRIATSPRHASKLSFHHNNCYRNLGSMSMRCISIRTGQWALLHFVTLVMPPDSGFNFKRSVDILLSNVSLYVMKSRYVPSCAGFAKYATSYFTCTERLLRFWKTKCRKWYEYMMFMLRFSFENKDNACVICNRKRVMVVIL